MDFANLLRKDDEKLILLIIAHIGLTGRIMLLLSLKDVCLSRKTEYSYSTQLYKFYLIIGIIKNLGEILQITLRIFNFTHSI
jgi:hypothetical protein